MSIKNVCVKLVYIFVVMVFIISVLWLMQIAITSLLYGTSTWMPIMGAIFFGLWVVYLLVGVALDEL